MRYVERNQVQFTAAAVAADIRHVIQVGFADNFADNVIVGSNQLPFTDDKPGSNARFFASFPIQNTYLKNTLFIQFKYLSGIKRVDWLQPETREDQPNDQPEMDYFTLMPGVAPESGLRM